MENLDTRNIIQYINNISKILSEIISLNHYRLAVSEQYQNSGNKNPSDLLQVNPQVMNSQIFSFIYNIFQNSNLSLGSLITAVIYIDKIINNKKFFLTEKNFFIMFITGITLSMKYNQDYSLVRFLPNIVGLNKRQFAQFETAFLELLDYECYVAEDMFQLFHKEILSH